MTEQPNLNYIKTLAGGDLEFEKKLIQIIKKEFPNECQNYDQQFEAKEYQKASEIVHKLKHKFSILGLESGYEFAVEYESELKEGLTLKHSEFKDILYSLTQFIESL